jgi:hypothetical protein
MPRSLSLPTARSRPNAASKVRLFALALLGLTSLTSEPVVSTAFADGMRCGTKLVSDGDTLYEVHSRCGDPKFSVRRMEQRTVRHWVGGPCAPGAARCGGFVERTIEVQIDEWTYDFGSTQFVRYLTFEQGVLVKVDTGSYGND